MSHASVVATGDGRRPPAKLTRNQRELLAHLTRREQTAAQLARLTQRSSGSVTADLRALESAGLAAMERRAEWAHGPLFDVWHTKGR